MKAGKIAFGADSVEESILKRLIIKNYFYFEALERKEILDVCYDIFTDEFNEYFDKKYNCLVNDFSSYLAENKSIILSGFINFRITSINICIAGHFYFC